MWCKNVLFSALQKNFSWLCYTDSAYIATIYLYTFTLGGVKSCLSKQDNQADLMVPSREAFRVNISSEIVWLQNLNCPTCCSRCYRKVQCHNSSEYSVSIYCRDMFCVMKVKTHWRYQTERETSHSSVLCHSTDPENRSTDLIVSLVCSTLSYYIWCMGTYIMCRSIWATSMACAAHM